MSMFTWAQFESCNENVHSAFENMCRMLFNRCFFNNKAILHSDHNNPGIEVEPILETKSNKRISFQSKYFTEMDYTQIRHSVNQTVKYYSGQLDVLYLYCNKDITITSSSYIKIKETCNNSNIELIPINNQEILNLVIDYPVITSLYFHQHNLTKEWFHKHFQISLNSLGSRYNK